MKHRYLLTLLLLIPCAAAPAHADDKGSAQAAALAHRYGMDHFDRIEALKFTFHVRLGTTTTTRTWLWEIPEGKVSVVTGDRHPLRHSYSTGNLAAGKEELNRRVDAWFVSDREWLLLPLQVINDHRGEITLARSQPLPIPPGSADRITVDYADASDSYRIYYDADRVIRQSVYRKTATGEPETVVTWNDLRRVGPILVSLRHKTADGRSEFWFSGVKARVQGSRRWVSAEPAN